MDFFKATLIAGSLLLGAGQAYACTCPPAGSAAEQAANYQLIFVGSPVESVDVTPARPAQKRTFWQRLQFWKSPPPPPPPPPIKSIETRFSVSRVLKGDVQDTVTISHSNPNPVSCGIAYNGESERLVLARKAESGAYVSWFCSIPQFSATEFEAALTATKEELQTGEPTEEAEAPRSDINVLIGTWGKDEAQCARLQEEQGAPLVLTLSSYNQHETHCTINRFSQTQPTGWQMDMSCSVEGYEEDYSEWLDVRDGKLLSSLNQGEPANEFIRCRAAD